MLFGRNEWLFFTHLIKNLTKRETCATLRCPNHYIMKGRLLWQISSI